MANKTRVKMNIEQRAKQFMPFAAVTGLDRELERKERELLYVERPVLEEESIHEIDLALRKLNKGDEVFISFFRANELHNINGIVEFINVHDGVIRVDDTRIDFADVLKVEA